MPTNPLNVKPTELIRLMNRAGFGTVLNESRLKTHRLNDINTADHKGIDLLKYAGWLTLEYFAVDNDGEVYLERKRKAAERNAEAVRAAQDIGKLPEVVDPNRKEVALHSFKLLGTSKNSRKNFRAWSRASTVVKMALKYSSLTFFSGFFVFPSFDHEQDQRAILVLRPRNSS